MPRTRPTAEITLVSPAEPHYGDTVVLHVKTDADASALQMDCFQGDNLVAHSGWVTKKGPEFDEDFGLSSGIWHEGGATCTARALDFSNGYNPKRPRYLDKEFTFEVLP